MGPSCHLWDLLASSTFQRIRADGGSQELSLTVNPVPWELLGAILGYWRGAGDLPKLPSPKSRIQDLEPGIADGLGRRKIQAGRERLGQIQPGTRRTHPRTSGAGMNPAGHKAPGMTRGMGGEGSLGCQECVRADKSSAGPWEGICFGIRQFQGCRAP